MQFASRCRSADTLTSTTLFRIPIQWKLIVQQTLISLLFATTISLPSKSKYMLNPTNTQKNGTIEDLTLIEQVKAGNLAAFEQLADRYDRQVFSIIARYVQNADDAKDLFQEVLIRIFRGLPKFQHRSEFSTWLFRVTTNVCLSHRFKNKKQYVVATAEKLNVVNADTQSGTLPYGITPDRQLEQKELSQHVRHALDKLPPKQRLVFTMKYLEGYKIREISEMLRYCEGTVKRYLFNAMRTVRDDLKLLHSDTA